MPEYFMRFRTIGRKSGTNFDYFIPVQDMPSDANQRGYDVFQDEHTTPAGNTFLYFKSRRRIWHLDFQDVSTSTKSAFEVATGGFGTLQQISVLFFGTALNSTATPGSLASVGQMWGTAFFKMPQIPRETSYDLWSFGVDITEFGANQTFT